MAGKDETEEGIQEVCGALLCEVEISMTYCRR